MHAQAPTADATDWRQIVALYDELLMLQPSPVIELNRAVAVSMVDGPERALELIDDIHADAMAAYLPFHIARGEMLRKLDRHVDAREAFTHALQLSTNPAERRLLERRIGE